VKQTTSSKKRPGTALRSQSPFLGVPAGQPSYDQ
jgi:hypothetical protein